MLQYGTVRYGAMLMVRYGTLHMVRYDQTEEPSAPYVTLRFIQQPVTVMTAACVRR